MTDKIRQAPVVVSLRPAPGRLPEPVDTDTATPVSDTDLARIDQLTDQAALGRGKLVSRFDW